MRQQINPVWQKERTDKNTPQILEAHLQISVNHPENGLQYIQQVIMS